MSMDEINESYRQHLIREQLEEDSDSSDSDEWISDEDDDDDDEIQYYEYG